MKIYLKNHDFRYAVEQSIFSLLPKISWEEDGNYLLSLLSQKSAQAIFQWHGTIYTGNVYFESGEEQFAIKTAVFQAIIQSLPHLPPWGSLTGVRPVKLATKLEIQGENVEEVLQEKYAVDKIRSKLAVDCLKTSLAAQEKSKGLSLYVHIPFCPSACRYCSFYTTNSLNLLPDYLEMLKKELLLAKNLPLSALYIGGGTPTVLSSNQLSDLCGYLRELFPDITEFTVEAGRPETITKEKLDTLKSFAVDRISINPQSMKNEILQDLGRNHSVIDIHNAFSFAEGHFNINMDLIAGISSREDFLYSLEEVLVMRPEQITVHALTPKKNTPLSHDYQAESGQKWVETLNKAWTSLRHHGYVPYYLYRQKQITQGLENVGWVLKEKKYCQSYPVRARTE